MCLGLRRTIIDFNVGLPTVLDKREVYSPHRAESLLHFTCTFTYIVLLDNYTFYKTVINFTRLPGVTQSFHEKLTFSFPTLYLSVMYRVCPERNVKKCEENCSRCRCKRLKFFKLLRLGIHTFANGFPTSSFRAFFGSLHGPKKSSVAAILILGNKKESSGAMAGL